MICMEDTLKFLKEQRRWQKSCSAMVCILKNHTFIIPLRLREAAKILDFRFIWSGCIISISSS